MERNEPECWTCAYFIIVGDKKCCVKHQVELPVDKGPYLICPSWHSINEGNEKILNWCKKNSPEEGSLYVYKLYSSEAPRVIALFSEMPKVMVQLNESN